MKKLILSVGTISAVAIPVVATVSCGSKKIDIAGNKKTNNANSAFDDSSRKSQNQAHETSLKQMLGENRFNEYTLSSPSDFMRKYTLGIDNNTYITSHKDTFASEFGSLFTQSAKAGTSVPFFSATLADNGVKNITALDAKYESLNASIPSQDIATNSIEEAGQKAFDLLDKFEADLQAIKQELEKFIIAHHLKVDKWGTSIQQLGPDQTLEEFERGYSKFSAPLDKAETGEKYKALLEQLKNAQDKKFIFNITKNNDATYKIEFFQMKQWVDLDAKGFPIHKATQIGDMSVGAVAEHLQNYLSISTQTHTYANFDYMMRFGDDDMWAKYFLDDNQEWVKHGTAGEVRPTSTASAEVTKSRIGAHTLFGLGGDPIVGKDSNGYKSGTGFARFNNHFEIFINAYFDFEDHTKLNIEFQINDKVYGGQNMLLKFGQVLNINTSTFPHASTTGSTDKQADAASALKELINFYKNPAINEGTKNQIASYMDVDTVNFIKNTSQLDKVQTWIADDANMALIYEAAKDYPGINVDVLASQLANIKRGSVASWMISDNQQKWNLLLGLRFVQWYINKNVLGTTK